MPLRSRAFARQKLCLDLYVSLHLWALVLHLSVVLRAWVHRLRKVTDKLANAAQV
jgi:hypothetical protein